MTDAREPVPERRDACVWTQGGWDERDLYTTECGQDFSFLNDSDRIGNGAFYCHHCGGQITERRLCDGCGKVLDRDYWADHSCAKCLAEINTDGAV